MSQQKPRGAGFPPSGLIVQFTGRNAQTIGQGYLPRGLYAFTNEGIEATASESGVPAIKLYMKIAQALVFEPGENGNPDVFRPEASLAGREITKNHNLPDGKNKGGDEAREGELKGALLGHGKPKKEVDAMRGGVAINPADFLDKSGFFLYDPPPPGSNEYPEIRYLDAETAGKIAQGQIRINQWPMDKKLEKAQKGAAAGGQVQTGAGSMLAGGGAPVPQNGGGFGGFAGGPPPQQTAPVQQGFAPAQQTAPVQQQQVAPAQPAAGFGGGAWGFPGTN